MIKLEVGKSYVFNKIDDGTVYREKSMHNVELMKYYDNIKGFTIDEVDLDGDGWVKGLPAIIQEELHLFKEYVQND